MLIKEPDPEIILSLASYAAAHTLCPLYLSGCGSRDPLGWTLVPQIPAVPLPMAGTFQHSLARSVFLPQCWGMVSRVGRTHGCFLPGQSWASPEE